MRLFIQSVHGASTADPRPDRPALNNGAPRLNAVPGNERRAPITRAESPSLAAGRVEGRVAFHNRLGCELEFVSYRLEREACGWAGCRWKVMVSGDYRIYPGTTATIWFGAPCHSGSSQYRTGGTWDGFHYTYSQAVRITC
jgi:hypothetical protein